MTSRDRLLEGNTYCILIRACARCDTGLRRIDGVSEETDTDGEVTSTFEYFRQPEEELGNLTTDIKPDVTDLLEETACSFPAAFWFLAPDVCPRTILAAGAARRALAAALGANSENGQHRLLNDEHNST